MLTAAGIGSGLDVESIVAQLMAVEREPLFALQRQQNQLETKLSALGKLKSTLSTFQTTLQELSTDSALKVYTATSTNENIFTASANSSAAPASFEIEVVRLAEHHKLASAEALDSDTFGGKNNDAMLIQVGADPADVLSVDLSTALTLGGIRDAINGAADNPGVAASIIFGNDGKQKLVLTAKDSGAAQALSLSYEGIVNAGDFGFQTVNDIAGDTSLLDAELVVDGYTVTRGVNGIDDVLTGITLDLHAADPGSRHTLTIGRDTEAVATSVQSFADAYNELRTAIGELRGGELEADSILLTIERRLQGILNTPASGLTSGYSYLTQVGVSFQKDGTLTVDSSALDAVLETEFGALAELFASAGQGFAHRLDSQIDDWLDVDGLLDIRSEGIESRQRYLENRELALERRLSLVEERYRAQFTVLDSMLADLQATSSFLTQQLEVLPGNGT